MFGLSNETWASPEHVEIWITGQLKSFPKKYVNTEHILDKLNIDTDCIPGMQPSVPLAVHWITKKSFRPNMWYICPST